MTSLDPLSLLSAMRLEDGSLWGDRAEPWQRADAAAFFDRSEGAPRRHYNLRGRGMSKTGDGSGCGLALLLAEAPARSRSHIFAADSDQARIALDSIGGYVQRSGLGQFVEMTSNAVIHRQTGASITVESSDGASAYGLRPWLTIVDELGVWPSTPNHRALWAAITSGVPKVKGSRLLVIGTAGSPASLGAEVWNAAETSALWRASKHAGPAPWWSAEDIEATKASLTPAEYARLIECEWRMADDSLSTAEDFEACVRAGVASLPPKSGRQYIASLDVGTRTDYTAFGIGHSERREAGRVIVIDKLVYWRPKDGVGGRVDLTEVEETVLRLCREYHVERVRNDRMQAEQLTGNLVRQGIKVDEYVFSATGASKLARALYTGIRDHSVEFPDDEELRTEAQTVRMVETTPTTIKLVNARGQHDDLLVACGMIVADLIAEPEIGVGSFSIPSQLLAARKMTTGATGPGGVPTSGFTNPAYRSRAVRGELAAIHSAQRRQTPAQRAAGIGLAVPGSANDR